jgi:signal transduction histidine kinase
MKYIRRATRTDIVPVSYFSLRLDFARVPLLNDAVTMQKREYVLWVAVGFSLLSHVIVVLQTAFSFPALGIPEEWRGQLYTIVGFSFAIGVVQFVFNRRRTTLLTLILLRVMALTVAAYSLRDSPFARTVLLSSLVFEIVMYLESPVAVGASALAIALALGAGGLAPGAEGFSLVAPEGLLPMLFFPLMIIALGAFLKRFQRLASERERLVDQVSKAGAQLVDANISLQDHILRGEEQARSLERERISRELHDTVGYTLMNIIALLKASVELARKDVDKMIEFLQQGIVQAQSGLSETRTALRALRTADQQRPSIVRALSRLAAAFKDTHIKVTVHFSNVPWHFGGEIDSVVYRIVQEGITNAIRHGNATEIAVHLSQDAGQIAVTVNDNGSGAEAVIEGIGLSGIRERLQHVEGEVSAGNIRGGFRLCARIPLKETA